MMVAMIVLPTATQAVLEQTVMQTNLLENQIFYIDGCTHIFTAAHWSGSYECFCMTI